MYIQNGTGPWSGIWISGTETLDRRRGDDITVTGTVEENYSVTRISGIDNPGNIQIHNTGLPLPDPEVLSTDSVGLLINGSVQAEQWESVLIKYENIVVNRENADGSPGILRRSGEKGGSCPTRHDGSGWIRGTRFGCAGYICRGIRCLGIRPFLALFQRSG